MFESRILALTQSVSRTPNLKLCPCLHQELKASPAGIGTQHPKLTTVKAGPPHPLSRQIPRGSHPVEGKDPRAQFLPSSIFVHQPEDVAVPVRTATIFRIREQDRMPWAPPSPRPIEINAQNFKKTKIEKPARAAASERPLLQTHCSATAGPERWGRPALGAACVLSATLPHAALRGSVPAPQG